MNPDVMVLLDSAKHAGAAQDCTDILDAFGVTWEMHVCSPHHTFADVKKHVEGPAAKVFVVIAAPAGALPGVVASATGQPVVTVPVSGGGPLASMLTMVQTSPGMPVATVGMDRGEDAAHLAAQMLGLADETVAAAVLKQRREAADKMRAEDAAIQPREAA